MGSQKLPISVSPIWADICPMGFLQTCVGSTSIHGDSSSHLPRRHSSYASINGATTKTADSIDMPAIQGSGSGGQSKEINALPSADPGVVGLPSGYSESTADFPGQETEGNTAVSPAPPVPIKGVSEGSSEVRNDLNWWCALDKKLLTQSSLQSTILIMAIELDASNMRLGARKGKLQIGGRCSEAETAHHISYLALLAAFVAHNALPSTAAGLPFR